MKEIPLTKGYVALVDDADFEWVSRHRWKVLKTKNTGPYALRNAWNSKLKKYQGLLMHRAILAKQFGDDAIKGKEVDHIDRNGLNNQRSNMRLCTSAQNKWNARKPKRNTSGVKGVKRFAGSRKKSWHAQMSVNGKIHHLGYFETKEMAAKAYASAAKRLRGEFA